MKLSVIVPCYNEKSTIRDIVDAIRNAPYPDKEIIIVDDCSSDGTRDVLREIDRFASQSHPLSRSEQRKGARLCGLASPQRRVTSS